MHTFIHKHIYTYYGLVGQIMLKNQSQTDTSIISE